MKKLSTVLFTGLCALGLTIGARAQTPAYSSQTVPIPATIAAAFTTNLIAPQFIDAHASQKVGFQLGSTWSTAGEATGNTNLVFVLCPTTDGLHWDTNKPAKLACYNYGAAGNTTYSCTNLDAVGQKGWYLTQIINNSAAGISTNGAGAFTYSVKVSTP